MRNAFSVVLLFIVGFSQSTQCAESPQELYKKEMSALVKRYKVEYENPIFDSIKPKIAMGEAPSLGQLTDLSRPNDSEKIALEAFYKIRKRYWADDLSITDKYLPHLSTTRRNFLSGNEKLLIDLYAGKISYGEFNSLRKDVLQTYINQVKQRNLELIEKSRSAKQTSELREKNDVQRAATCNHLRTQLKKRYEERDSWISSFKDAAAWGQGGTNGPTAALSARTAEKESFNAQTVQLEDRIIRLCGAL